MRRTAWCSSLDGSLQGASRRGAWKDVRAACRCVRLDREAREIAVELAPERVVERWNALVRTVGA